MKNEQMMSNAPRSLGKSLDELRENVLGLAEDIEELYDLDEDNWKQIKAMRTGIGELSKRIDGLQNQIRRNRGRMVLGFLGLSGLVYAGYKAIDRIQDELNKLEEDKGAQAEESDG